MTRALPAVALVLLVVDLSGRQPAEPLAGGNGTIYIGGFPGRILILDEATEKQVGEIRLKHGAPRTLDLSQDRKRFYVRSATMEDVEIVDLATRASIGDLRLSEGRKKVWIRSLTSDPQHRFLILLTKSANKLIDRFEIGPPTLVVFDLKEKKITRTIPWPEGEEREFVRIMMSPDGKYLYFFSDDVLIYETKEFKQVDKWELSRPLEEGLGRLNFGPMETLYDEPGFYTGLFTVQDPVQNRRIMGIARVDLVGKRVDFRPVGPARPVGFALAPDRKRAYGLLQEIGRYEFWCFDVEKHRVLSRSEFAGRPRMSLSVSSNGKLLYIYNAGNTIDVHDAETYRHLRRVTLDFDSTTELHIIPPARAGTAAGPR